MSHPNFRHDGFSKGSSTFTCECCGKRTRNSSWNNWDGEMCGHCVETFSIENSISDNSLDATGFDFKTSRTDTPEKLNARFWKFIKETKQAL